MTTSRPVQYLGLLSVLGILGSALCIQATPPAKVDGADDSAASLEHSGEAHRVPIAVARDRAKVTHEIYLSTLTVMHDRYFHANRSTLPARAMEDVFSDLAEQSKMESRWIAVNAKAMSVDHEPQTDFEKKAAKEIASGKSELELIDDGVYHRATAVPLASGCVGCHTGFSSSPPKSPRFAGLVTTIPLAED